MYATVQELVDALTPEEKIGQLFIIRPDALDLMLPQDFSPDGHVVHLHIKPVCDIVKPVYFLIFYTFKRNLDLCFGPERVLICFSVIVSPQKTGIYDIRITGF